MAKKKKKKPSGRKAFKKTGGYLKPNVVGVDERSGKGTYRAKLRARQKQGANATGADTEGDHIRPDRDMRPDWEIAREETGGRIGLPRRAVENHGYDFRNEGAVLVTETYLVDLTAERSVYILEKPIEVDLTHADSGFRPVTVVAVEDGVETVQDFSGEKEIPKWRVGYIVGYDATTSRGQSKFVEVDQVTGSEAEVKQALGDWSAQYGLEPLSSSPDIAGAQRVHKPSRNRADRNLGEALSRFGFDS